MSFPIQAFYYVNIVKAVQNLCSDETFIKVLEDERSIPGNKDLIREFHDESLVKTLPFFINHQDAYCGMMYSDAVEVVNPLGCAKGRHEILQSFWSIIDIGKKHRSRIDTTLFFYIKNQR